MPVRVRLIEHQLLIITQKPSSLISLFVYVARAANLCVVVLPHTNRARRIRPTNRARRIRPTIGSVITNVTLFSDVLCRIFAIPLVFPTLVRTLKAQIRAIHPFLPPLIHPRRLPEPARRYAPLLPPLASPLTVAQRPSASLANEHRPVVPVAVLDGDLNVHTTQHKSGRVGQSVFSHFRVLLLISVTASSAAAATSHCSFTHL